MKKLKKIAAATFLLLVWSSWAQITSAQVSSFSEEDQTLGGASKTIPNTVDCFDYYKFGSVQVDVHSEIQAVIPGVPLVLEGKISNGNDYPVVDGSVYVKIFRKQSDETKAHSNGNFLVDQFVAKDGISLAANGEQDINFEWKVPDYAVSGDYQVATFFVSGGKFYLLGLPFTDDVLGNIFDFSVKDGEAQTVLLEKNGVTMNGEKYNFASFPLSFPKDDPVELKTSLVNTTKETQTVPVVWTLYSWDASAKENVIETKTENVTLSAGESKDLSYIVSDSDRPVYFVVAQSDYKGSKSILDMRFLREGVDRVKLNFPSITDFPLVSGKKTTIFPVSITPDHRTRSQITNLS